MEENAGRRLAGAQRRQLLREAARHLGRRERQIIELRYLGEEQLTYPEISQTLGLTPERARQLENLALASLRLTLAGAREGITD